MVTGEGRRRMAQELGGGVARTRILALSIVIVALSLCGLVGFTDFLSHGHYSEHIDMTDIREDDLVDGPEIGPSPTKVCDIKPTRPHVNGLEVCVSNYDRLGDEGLMSFEIRDDEGNVVTTSTIDLSTTMEATAHDGHPAIRWFHPTLGTELRQGSSYELLMSSTGCSENPVIQGLSFGLPDGDTAGSESLVFTAWALPTLSLYDRVLVMSMIVGVALVAVSSLLGSPSLRKVAAASALTGLMCWNFCTSGLVGSNAMYEDFQADSEALVYMPIQVTINGRIEKASPYGLGNYEDAMGFRRSIGEPQPRSDEEWRQGYSWDEPAVSLSNDGYSQSVAQPGNSIVFANGEIREIVSSSVDEKHGEWLVCKVAGDANLSMARNGSISLATFRDAGGNALPNGFWHTYESCYGLQGKVLRLVAKGAPSYERAVEIVRCLVSLLASIALVALTMLVDRKYNRVAAICAYAVALLSPWMTCFGASAYWIPFAWILPVVLGLACTLAPRRSLASVVCHVGIVLAVALKCLCGYEYISAILLAMVSFGIADFVGACARRDREEAIGRGMRVLTMGLCGIAGFLVAILLHAGVRGGGDIGAGMLSIFTRDVLRRTSGGGLDSFASDFWPSLNASRWEVLVTYVTMKTELVAGVPGTAFAPLSLAALALLIHDVHARKANWELIALWMVMLCATVSWLVLAKSHSFIHTHISYVLWYFGFVQVTAYVLASHIRDWARMARHQGDGKSQVAVSYPQLR